MLTTLALLAAACSAEEPAPDTAAPTTGGPVTVAPTTTAPPTTTTAPATTAAPGTTVSPSTTTAPTTTTTTLPPSIDEVELGLELVAQGFRQPVLVTAPDDDPRLFVVDQPGIVWVIDGGDPEVFLDISDDVSFGGERGLLGLAFHPGYAGNGLFYVNYTARDGATIVDAFSVSADPARADPTSREQILRVAQPAGNHNGGMIAFGPAGHLWIGMGDGGASNDRFRNGQDPDTVLGAMLRISVGPDIDGYEIPADNPFVTGGGAPEVWATGLRNPWRFAFGPAAGFGTDVVFIADVGQNRIEEVNAVSADTPGLNYGWPVKEGSECFRSESCDGFFVPPVAEYSHSEGCSVTGGFVYEGAAIPALRGHYLYGDYCTGFVRSVLRRQAGDDVTEITEHDLLPAGSVRNLTSFGRDASGELYLLSQGGAVFRLVEA